MNRNIKYDYSEFKNLYNEHDGNISRLATLLSKTRPTIRNWIKKMQRDDELIQGGSNAADAIDTGMKNRLELLLAMDEYADYYLHNSNNGVYAMGSTMFIAYGVTHNEADMIGFINKVINHEIQVNVEGEGIFYNSKPYDCFDDYTRGGADHAIFSFISIPKGKEEALIPYIRDTENVDIDTLGVDVVHFAWFRDGTILGKEQSKQVIHDEVKAHAIRELEAICNFVPVPDAFLHDFKISIFAEKHFPQCTTNAQIDKMFRELSKVHHPDKGGDSLMFKALGATKCYLKDKNKLSKVSKLTA